MTKTARSELTDEKHRMLASISFVAVLIVIGFPLWWKTTETYRVSLPYDKIEALQNAELSVVVKVTVLANDEPTAQEIAGLLRQTLPESGIIATKIEGKVLPDELRKSISSVAEEKEVSDLVSGHYDTNVPGHVYIVQWNRLASSAWLGVERVVLFKDATAGVTVCRVVEQWVQQRDTMGGATQARSSGAAGRSTRLPPHAHYAIVLTVAYPAPHQYQLQFNAKEALEDYIGTFLDELSTMHNFTLKSQWVHLLELDFQAEKNGPHYEVRRARLAHVLSPLEKRAGAHVTSHAHIRLVLYAVPCEIAPLFILDEQNKVATGPIAGFMSPRWGGVVLASPDEASCSGEGQPHRTFAPSLPVVMGTFLAQLRELLGFHKLPRIDGAVLAPLRSVTPRAWETDAVRNLRTVEQFTSAKLTLNSIAELLGKIRNMVINDEVGASIRSSTEHAELARLAAASGNLAQAYHHSQEAMLAAEYAFTSPSLLALLYFPDDQKYAIYIPLFLPIMIPVLMSLKNIFAWLRGKKVKTD